MNRPLAPLPRMLMTAFGLGFCRPASGTWGSLPPVILAGLLLAVGLPGDGIVFGVALAAVTGLASASCVRFGDGAISAFGRKDPSQVVADEVAGMALVLTFLPPGSTATPAMAAITLLLAFLAFRFLDIVKPWPASALEGLPGGWGILLDDLMAGLYAIVGLSLAALVI